MGKNFAYLVSEKFATSDNDENFLSEDFLMICQNNFWLTIYQQYY